MLSIQFATMFIMATDELNPWWFELAIYNCSLSIQQRITNCWNGSFWWWFLTISNKLSLQRWKKQKLINKSAISDGFCLKDTSVGKRGRV